MGRFGLRKRFILVITLLFLALFSIVSYVLIQQFGKNARNNLNEQARSFASLATAPIGNAYVLYGDSGSVRVDQQINKYVDLSPDVTGVAITDTQGNIVYSKGVSAAKLSTGDATSFDTRIDYRPDGTISRIISPFIEDFGSHRYNLIYTVSNQRIDVATRQILGTIILVSSILFVVLIAVTYTVMARLFIQPISQISSEARQISSGQFDRQIILKRADELGDLAVAVNSMANRLKSDIAKLQETDRLKSEFMTITSHNLRTPLTVINGYLEELKSMKVPSELKPAIEAINTNVLRLDNFTDDVLTISMMESGEHTMYDLASVQLKPYLEDIANSFTNIAKEKNQRINVDIALADEHALISGPRLKNALWNLLDNAHKFTGEGGHIDFKAEANNEQVVISIIDSGIGISQDELPKLFTKFHRATGLLDYNYEGTGIGLYITKLIVESQHGTVDVESAEGKGATFIIRLPIANSGVTATANTPHDQASDIPKGLI